MYIYVYVIDLDYRLHEVIKFVYKGVLPKPVARREALQVVFTYLKIYQTHLFCRSLVR